MTLMSGTIISQAIPILLSPVLSRLYAPEEFGVFSLFTSIAAAVAVISTFRYELAIMLPEKEGSAANILRLSFIITLSLTALCALIVAVFHSQIPLWLHTPELRVFQYYIPVFLLLAGITQALNYWISRQKKFRLLAAGRVGQTGTTGAISILLGYLNYSSLGLIIGTVAGQLSSCVIYAAGSLKKIVAMQPYVSRPQVAENFRRYKTFMLVNTPHALLNVAQDLIVIFLINYFFSKTILGWYAFSYRILKVPAAFIGAAVFQVYFQRASTLKNDGKGLQQLTKKLYLQLFSVGLPIFTILAIFAPQLFSLIFGKDWFEAGRIAQLISPWLFLNFIMSPISAITIVLNKQQWAIWFTVVDTLLRSAAIIIGGIYGNDKLAFVLLSAGSGSLLLYALYWFYGLPMRVKNVDYGKIES
jgi:O-antigen/teichoic acid export membrane protein